MRIVFPFVGDSIGGSHLSALALYSALKLRSYDTRIVLHDSRGSLASYLKKKDIRFDNLPLSDLAGTNSGILSVAESQLRCLYPIYKYIKENKIKIVHGNDLRINLTWSVATSFTRASYVWHQRQPLSMSKKWRYVRFLSDHIISISEFVDRTLPNNINQINRSLIYNPFDLGRILKKEKSKRLICERYALPSSSLIIGYVGRLVDWKNVELLIHSFSKLNSSARDKYGTTLKLFIVGNNNNEYSEYLASIVHSLGLSQTVIFTGFTDNPELYLSSFDIAVMPSKGEAFGRTLVESMIQGTTVLASDSGAHSEIISHGFNGYLFRSGDIEDLCQKLLMLINHSDIRDNLSQNASAATLKKYSVENHWKSVADIYNKIVSCD